MRRMALARSSWDSRRASKSVAMVSPQNSRSSLWKLFGAASHQDTQQCKWHSVFADAVVGVLGERAAKCGFDPGHGAPPSRTRFSTRGNPHDGTYTMNHQIAGTDPAANRADVDVETLRDFSGGKKLYRLAPTYRAMASFDASHQSAPYSEVDRTGLPS